MTKPPIPFVFCPLNFNPTFDSSFDIHTTGFKERPFPRKLIVFLRYYVVFFDNHNTSEHRAFPGNRIASHLSIGRAPADHIRFPRQGTIFSSIAQIKPTFDSRD